MKVYSSPIPAPEYDYANYDRDKVMAAEDEHSVKLKAWLLANGYNGKRTGEIASFPIADGYASYMLGDGKKSCLIHLPYGDAYNYPDVRFLPKAEVLKRIDSSKRMAALFAKKS